MSPLTVLTLILVPLALAIDCDLLDPVDGGPGNIGFIFVPGAQIDGTAYGPIVAAIQAAYPGSVWGGLTKGWLGTMPNPIEIAGAVDACLQKAEDSGYDTSTLFFGGHSLGGIVLENFISGHGDLAQAIVLFGSYIPDLIGEGSNEFPVPVLTAVGSLDGGGLSYLAREFQEVEVLPLEKNTFAVVIEDVNHAQVASGEIPESVIENDIDPELTEGEAHSLYAAAAAAFIVINTPEDMYEPGTVANMTEYIQGLKDNTREFLQPFFDMASLEFDGVGSPWMTSAQEKLLGLSEIPANLVIEDITLDAISLGLSQPYIYVDETSGQVKVFTYSNFQHDTDPVDFNHVLSASTIKAKLKLADVVLKALGLPAPEVRIQCADVNRLAFETALAVVSEKAKDRYVAKGRQLVFGPDTDAGWGPGWEFNFGLSYEETADGKVELTSVKLISEEDFILPDFAGMNYCDVLSPYRALEWIYVNSIRHGFFT